VTNNSGTAGTWYYDVTVGGTLVFRDSFTHNNASVRALNAQFALIRESATAATFAQVGVNVNVGSTTLGFGDVGATANGFSVIATNITVDWSAGVPVVLAVSSDTVVTTNTAYGLRVANSWLRTDAVASTGSGTGNVTGPASSTNNAIVLFSGTGGTNIADSGVLLSSLQTYDTDLDDLADGSLSGSKVGSGIDAGNITVGTLSSNRLPSAVAFTSMSVGTINATSVTGDAAGLTGINGTNITAGTVAAARIDSAIARLASPTLASPTLNDTVTFEQTILSAHSTVTNFVADPTVSPYQTINADLTTPFATVGFLHATNVAAGRQTTILVFAGTNASVTVSLSAQFARNTNSVALTTGQILPISFYGYGSSPTNVIATMGTPYTR